MFHIRPNGQTDMANDSVPERFLRIDQVLAVRGDGRSSLYNEISAGLYPRPVRTGIGCRRSAWPESEVAAVQKARMAGVATADIRRLVQTLEARRVHLADGVMRDALAPCPRASSAAA